MSGQRSRFEFTDTRKLFTPVKKGAAEIVVDVPSKLERLMGNMKGMPLDRDKYVRLLVDGDVVMTDAEFERMTNGHFLREMHGDCLIAGLGLGFILAPALRVCDTVTVIEKNQDVIDLVSPKFKNKKLTIVHGDIKQFGKKTWPKFLEAEGKKYDTIYLDIWADFNEDTSREAGTIKRGLRKFLKPDGWIGDWSTQAMKFSRRR